jgi:NAD(P)-dependent dehydrogenase (short-subunit alcohol dehydrogenase family)
VVNVSSDAHRNGRINFDDLEGKQHYNGWRAYAQSKLANVLFTYELARRLEGTGVTANALHPGFVATGFGHNNRDLVGWGTRLAQRLAARTPEQGAQTSIYLAASPAVEGVTGKYFVDEKPVPSSPLSYDQSVARQLWEVSAAMTGLDNIPPVLGSQS